MGSQDDGRLVVDEDAANSRYLEIMRRKVEQKISVAVSRSATWTGSGLPSPTIPTIGSLVGRVGLSGPEKSVGGSNFYIGPWHVNEEDLVVFSWAAPVAAAYYGFDDSGFELESDVVCRRTLSLDEPGPRVVEVTDEWVCEPDGFDPFENQRKLVVPAPPDSTGRSENVTPEVVRAVVKLKDSDAPDMVLKTPVVKTQEVRGETAVRRALAAPRKNSLPALLGTLQPEQYDFVTRPADQTNIIQGHPGTGKTVIASHRAAFLTHPEQYTRGYRPRILLVGPTSYYAKHVRQVLDSLVLEEDRPRCMSKGIGQLMVDLRQFRSKIHGGVDATYFEVSYELGAFVEAAEFELQARGDLRSARSHIERTRLIYEAVRTNRANGVDLTDDQDSIKALRALPPWKTAISLTKYLPLIAKCSVSRQAMDTFRFDHIIVDEAQDVRPLEWQLLASCNRSNAWTILGDMNQRRTDHSFTSWDLLVADTGIISDPESFAPSTFVMGYRSTARIMTFANHLLPLKERKMENIQEEGLNPSVLKSSAKNLNKGVVDAALDLVSAYPDGTVAIISPAISKLKEYLLRESWIQGSQDKRYWSKSGITFSLVSPDIARGLEFDGVVVVEPKDFPTNLARLGSLYTSLTRANKELTIVHSKGLPDELRKANRK